MLLGLRRAGTSRSPSLELPNSRCIGRAASAAEPESRATDELLFSRLGSDVRADAKFLSYFEMLRGNCHSARANRLTLHQICAIGDV